MNIIDAGVEAVTISDPLKRIEFAGRVCYNSQDKIAEDTAAPFVRRLIAHGHQTPLEAARVTVSMFDVVSVLGLRRRTQAAASIVTDLADRRIPRCSFCADTSTFTINVRDLYNLLSSKGCDAVNVLFELLAKPDTAMSEEFSTFKITCDRGIGNELVRHRVLHYDDVMFNCSAELNPVEDDMSMVQASTRYISYGKQPFAVIRPVPAPWAKDESSDVFKCWKASCENSILAYNNMLEAGVAPQYARNVLPLSTATTIVMSGTASQWDYFLDLRTAEGAHPQMRYLALLLLNTPEMRRLLTTEGFEVRWSENHYDTVVKKLTDSLE